MEMTFMIDTDASLGQMAVLSSLCLLVMLWLTTVDPKYNCSAVQHRSTHSLTASAELSAIKAAMRILYIDRLPLLSCPLAVPHWIAWVPYSLFLAFTVPVIATLHKHAGGPFGNITSLLPLLLTCEHRRRNDGAYTKSFAGSTWRSPCSTVHLPLP